MNKEQKQTVTGEGNAPREVERVKAQRDALLAALADITSRTNRKYQFCEDKPMPEAHREWRKCIDKASLLVAEQQAAAEGRAS